MIPPAIEPRRVTSPHLTPHRTRHLISHISNLMSYLIPTTFLTKLQGLTFLEGRQLPQAACLTKVPALPSWSEAPSFRSPFLSFFLSSLPWARIGSRQAQVRGASRKSLPSPRNFGFQAAPQDRSVQTAGCGRQQHQHQYQHQNRIPT